MASLTAITVKPKGGGGGGYICKVPLDMLSQDGVPPEQGDTVSYQVDGTVQSVDAEDATIKITAVDGQPVDESAADETAEDQGAGSDTGAGTSPSGTAALGAALRQGAKGQPMPF